MNKVNYIFFTLPNFALNALESNAALCQRPVSTMRYVWQSVARAENLGGWKLLLNSLTLVKQN